MYLNTGCVKVKSQWKTSKEMPRTKIESVIAGKEFAPHADPGENESNYSEESEYCDAELFFKANYNMGGGNNSDLNDEDDEFWMMMNHSSGNNNDIHAENFIGMLTDEEFFKVFTVLGLFELDKSDKMKEFTQQSVALEAIKKWYKNDEKHQEKLHEVLEKKRVKSKLGEVSAAIDEAEK